MTVQHHRELFVAAYEGSTATGLLGSALTVFRPTAHRTMSQNKRRAHTRLNQGFLTAVGWQGQHNYIYSSTRSTTTSVHTFRPIPSKKRLDLHAACALCVLPVHRGVRVWLCEVFSLDDLERGNPESTQQRVRERSFCSWR